MLHSVTKRAWIALGVLGTVLTLLFLPLSWNQRTDLYIAWGPVLQAIGQVLLIAYAVLLTAWLFWIDIRPELRHRRAAREINAPDTGDALQLKEEVVNFATRYLKPAFEDLLEAHRISAYVIKDSWDHPAKFLIWQAFAQLQSYDGRYFLLVNRPPQMMSLNKVRAQLVSVELLKQYQSKMHNLVDVVKILRDNGKPLTPHLFDRLLRNWLGSHGKMLEALERLQAMPGLERMQEFDTRAGTHK